MTRQRVITEIQHTFYGKESQKNPDIKIYNELIAVESAVRGWKIFNHSVAIGGGNKFDEIHRLIQAFKSLKSKTDIDQIVQKLKSRIKYPFRKDEKQNLRKFKYTQKGFSLVDSLIMRGAWKELAKHLYKTIKKFKYDSSENEQSEWQIPKGLKSIGKTQAIKREQKKAMKEENSLKKAEKKSVTLKKKVRQ